MKPGKPSIGGGFAGFFHVPSHSGFDTVGAVMNDMRTPGAIAEACILKLSNAL